MAIVMLVVVLVGELDGKAGNGVGVTAPEKLPT